MKTLNQKMKELSPARRKKIKARSAQLIAEEMSLREVRQAHRLTQERVAEALGNWPGPSLPPRTAQRLSDFDVTQLH